MAATLGALVHLGVLGHPFVYDDQVTVVDNPSIRSLGNLAWIASGSLSRPVVNLSYALDHALWGLRPFGYHLTGLLLHAANVALLFGVVRRAAEDWLGRDPARAAAVHPHGLAFATATLFAVHPIATEAVGYVSGRAEVLAGTFVLLALRIACPALGAGRVAPLAAAVGAFLLGLGAKETAAVFPLLLVLYDRLLVAGSPAAWRRRLRGLHAPLVGLVILAAGLRLGAYYGVETGRPAGAPLGPYLLTQAEVFWRYVGLLLAPVSQSVFHEVQVVGSLADPRLLLALAGIGAVIVGAAWLTPRAPLGAWGIAWFLLCLAPTSLVALWEPMAERRVYLASAGFLLAAVAGLSGVREALAARGLGERRLRVATGAALIGALAVLGGLTVARTRVWADPVTLWRDAADKAPATWAPHNALGDALRAQGRCREAVGAYQAAIRIRPGESAAHTNVGICLVQLGQLDAARRALGQAVRLDPRLAAAHYNLGVAAYLAGQPEEARRHFERAVREDPRQVPAREHLIVLHETVWRDTAAALRLCRELREVAPSHPGAEDCIRRNTP